MLPLTVQWFSVTVAEGFSWDRPPPNTPAELPLMVQSVSVVVPLLYRPPPLPSVLPPVIFNPESDAVTSSSTWKTRLLPPPSMVTPARGPVIASVPVVSLNSSWLPFRGIICTVRNTVRSKVMVWSPPVALAWAIAWRKSIVPAAGVSVGLVTTMVDGT